MKKVIAIVVTILTSVSCASSEVPGLRAKLYNIPYDFEFRNNPKFHESLSTKFALSTETAALTNIDFDLLHKMDSNVFVEEHSGYFVAPIDGIYEFSLDAQIEARFQIGAGDTCHSDAYNSVSTENALKSPGSKNLAVDLKKGNVYPIRVAQYLSKDAESGKPFISLLYMNPKGEYVNDISPYIYQAEAGVAPYSSTGTLKTSVRSCGGIELTGQTILRRVADFDKKKYDIVRDAKTSAFKSTGYVQRLEPQAKIYESIVNLRKFAVEITGFMKVQNSGTYKFEVNLQGAVALQVGQAGQDMANNQPLLALNAKAKPEIRSQKKTLLAEEVYPIRIVFINKRAKAQFALKVYHEKEALDLQTIFYTDSFLSLVNFAVEGSENTSGALSLEVSRSLDTTGEQELGVSDVSGDSIDLHYLSALQDSFEEGPSTFTSGNDSLHLDSGTDSFVSLSEFSSSWPSKAPPKGARSRKPRSPSRNQDQIHPSQIEMPSTGLLLQTPEDRENPYEPLTNLDSSYKEPLGTVDAPMFNISSIPSGIVAPVSGFEEPLPVPDASILSVEDDVDSRTLKALTGHIDIPSINSSEVLSRPDEALASYYDLSSEVDEGLALLNHSASRNDFLVDSDDTFVSVNDSLLKDQDLTMRAAIDLKTLEPETLFSETLATKGEEDHLILKGEVEGISTVGTSGTFEALQGAFPVLNDNHSTLSVEQFKYPSPSKTSVQLLGTESNASVSEPCVMALQPSKQALSAVQVQFAPESNVPFLVTSLSGCELQIGELKAQDHIKIAKGQVVTNTLIFGVCLEDNGHTLLEEKGALSSSGDFRAGFIDGVANSTRVNIASNFLQQLGGLVLCGNRSIEVGERPFSCGTVQRSLNLTRSSELSLCGTCEVMCPVRKIEVGLSESSEADPAEKELHDSLHSAANTLNFPKSLPYADSQVSILSQTATSLKISGSGLPLSLTCIENCGALTVGSDAEASISTIGNDLSILTSLRRGNTNGSVETLPAAVGNIYDAGAVSKRLRKIFLLAAYVTLLW